MIGYFRRYELKTRTSVRVSYFLFKFVILAPAGMQYFTTYGRVYVDKELLFGQSKTYKYKVQLLYWDGSMSKMSDENAINYTP